MKHPVASLIFFGYVLLCYIYGWQYLVADMDRVAFIHGRDAPNAADKGVAFITWLFSPLWVSAYWFWLALEAIIMFLGELVF